jgi:hypothetical protein
MLPYEDRLVINGRVANISIGPAARHLGLLAATLSRWDEAERHFERAIEMGVRTGERPWLAHSRFDYASMLRARDAEGDDDRAARLLDQALEAADELGMARLAEQARSAGAAARG